MERYNHRTNGYEAQGKIEVAQNGCQPRMYRFTLIGCETAANDDCMQGYRVVFRTETCDGHYYELTGYVREMQENGCKVCGQQNGAYAQQNGAYAQRCNNCRNDGMIVDHAECAADETVAIWTECGEKPCGCGRMQKDNAFTYESIRREQKNGICRDNWFNGNHGNM